MIKTKRLVQLKHFEITETQNLHIKRLNTKKVISNDDDSYLKFNNQSIKIISRNEVFSSHKRLFILQTTKHSLSNTTLSVKTFPPHHRLFVLNAFLTE